MVSNQTYFKLTNKLCSFNFEFMLFYVWTDQQAPNSNIPLHLRADVCKYRPEVGKIKFLKNPQKIM